MKIFTCEEFYFTFYDCPMSMFPICFDLQHKKKLNYRNNFEGFTQDDCTVIEIHIISRENELVVIFSFT
jgi:hypothetical protein